MSYNSNKNTFLWYLTFFELFLNLIIIILLIYFTFAEQQGGFNIEKFTFWYGIVAIISGIYMWYHSIQIWRGNLFNDWRYQTSTYLGTAIIGGLLLTIEYFINKGV